MSSFQFPWESEAASVEDAPVPGGKTAPKRRGRPWANRIGPDPLGWRYHHLTITGPTELVEKLAAAARGSGVTPWASDGAGVEEDIFNLAAAQPPALRRLSVDGCRVLARQFRDRFEAHHARAAARVGHSLVCPFDLHALLPVPDAILRLGAADVSAQAWLAANWGTERLRHVARRKDAGPGRRLPRGHAVIGYGFFTSGETPQAAITTVAARWPELRFVLQPRPG